MNRQVSAASSAATPAQGHGKERQPYLDSLRGIACLLVVFYHLNVNIGSSPVILWGFTGVHVFFVLSGYLICKPFIKALSGTQPLPKVASFYLKRFIRIYPPYLVALLIYIGLRFATHSKIPTTGDIVSHIGLLFNYGPQNYYLSINPAFWSLSIEAQFYLALPLIAFAVFAMTRRGAQSVLIFISTMLTIGLLWRAGEFMLVRNAAGPSQTGVYYFRTLPAYLDLFGAGALVAAVEMLPVAEKLRNLRTSLLLLVCGVLVFLGANVWCTLVGHGDWLTINNTVYTIFFPVVLCLGIVLILIPSVLYFGERSRWLNLRFFVWLGSISYSVYLYHIGVQFMVLKFLHLENLIPDYNLRNIACATVSLVPVIVISAITYLLVEKPCLSVLAQMSKANRQSPVAPSAKATVISGQSLSR